SVLARLTDQELRAPEAEDDTIFTQRSHNHFSAIPLTVANAVAYVAIATPGVDNAQLDEQRFKTLSLLCNQAALSLERITLRRMMQQEPRRQPVRRPADES
ncbi:MAG TPA: hypothetical protein VLB27_10730, partial [candidate division Zixibacteria bacterium]|nr:hypothetical protein [candidate division Zixibacteria bacterium]